MKIMLNETKIIAIYCMCEDIVEMLGINDDVQCRMSTAEIMTFAIIAATIYKCDYKTTRLMSLYHKYFDNVLSHSRLVRRIHNIPDHVWFFLYQSQEVIA